MKNKTSKPWTKEELDVILQHVKNNGPQFCSEVLESLGFSRSRTACGQKARKLGLAYEGPPKGRFKKGSTPANKGKTQTAYQRKMSSKTWFKKGSTPKNTRPIGYEKFRSDMYWWVKVGPNDWRQKHRALWESEVGPIPPGQILVFKDGNPHNIDIENLELITRAEAVTRNRWGQISQYSLISKRAARLKLKKRGVKPKTIRENPELLEIAQKEVLITTQKRKHHGTKSRK